MAGLSGRQLLDGLAVAGHAMEDGWNINPD